MDLHIYGHRSELELPVIQGVETCCKWRRIHSYLGPKTIEELETEMFNEKVA